MTYVIYAVVCSSTMLYLVRDSLVSLILEVTHKDMTLTGRTDIWLVAQDAIKHNLLLGMGQSGFWVEGNPYAEKIWLMEGISNKKGFSLHNTYYDVLATLGILGLFLYTILLIIVMGRQIWAIFKNPTTIQITWTAVSLFFIFLTGVENFAPSAMNYYMLAFTIGQAFHFSARPRRVTPTGITPKEVAWV